MSVHADFAGFHETQRRVRQDRWSYLPIPSYGRRCRNRNSLPKPCRSASERAAVRSTSTRTMVDGFTHPVRRVLNLL